MLSGWSDFSTERFSGWDIIPKQVPHVQLIVVANNPDEHKIESAISNLESQAMEIILAALAAGAAAAAKDTAGTAVKDAYESLKALIKKKFAEKGKTDDSDIVDKHEKKPDSEGVKTLLKEELLEAKIDRDAEVIKTAEELLKQLKPEEFAAGKYNINVGDDIKGMVGDGTLKGIAGDISGGDISQNIN